MIEMKKRITSSEALAKKENTKVILAGWAAHVKSMGKIAFVTLRDRDNQIQLITTNKNLIKQISKITKESVILISGKIKKSKLKSGKNEIELSEIEVLSLADASLPIDISGKIETDLSKRLDWRWIDLRTRKNLLIFKVLSKFLQASRDFFIKNGLIELCSPKLIAYPSEGGGEEFALPYFGRKAYLAQSPQFYKQMAQAAGFEGVFEIAPVFRANPSHTSRHDTEYTSLDLEISWVDDEELRQFEEKWLVYVLKEIKTEFGKEIKKTFNVEINIPKIPFPRITMSEALKIVTGGKTDLDSEGEKKLGDYILKKYKTDFAFITEFPWSIRPFYHMRPENKKLTKSFDMIYKGIELTTGANREHRYNILVEQAKEKGLSLNSIEFYLNFFKYGCPPHSGLGLSPTRFVMQLLELGNVREATFAPRDTERLVP